ncbi:MAG: hypothetical protein R3B98_07345 [Hyphomonas sp.]
MADKPLRHSTSEALRRVVRRRDRRRKPGANSGEKVYSWAEYSEVNFTPTGDRSAIGCVFAGIGGLGALLIVPLIFALAGYDKASSISH